MRLRVQSRIEKAALNRLRDEPEKWIQFAWASGALVTTLQTDYAQPADEEMVWSVWEGNARVRR